MRGETVSPRAIKIDGQWKVLISKTLLLEDPAPEARPAGIILIQLPITGLSFALSAVDVSNGSLLLLQVVPIYKENGFSICDDCGCLELSLI